MKKGKRPARSKGTSNTWLTNQPYNTLPLLPPLVELETRAILKACIPARAASAELKQASEMIPNQSILINTLPLLESQASSEIENIVTTTDRLFQRQHLDENADPATQEALRYSQTLFEGYRSLSKRPFNTHTAEKICSKIKGHEMQIVLLAG